MFHRDDTKRCQGKCIVVPVLSGCYRSFVRHIGCEIEEGQLLVRYSPISAPPVICKLGLEAQQSPNELWQHRGIRDVCLICIKLGWNRGVGAVGDGGDDSVRGSTTSTQGPEEIRVLIVVCSQELSRGKNDRYFNSVVNTFELLINLVNKMILPNLTEAVAGRQCRVTSAC